MALLTKKDFAERCGLKNPPHDPNGTKRLSIEKSRGKVVYEENGLVDDCNSINRAFMVLSTSKSGVKKEAVKETKIIQIPREETFKPVAIDDEDMPTEDDDGIMNEAQSQKVYLHERALRTQKLKELAQIEIEKQMGLLVDFNAVQALFSSHSRTITNGFKNVLENMLSLISAKFSLSNKESADLRKEGLIAINKANDDAIEETKRGLKVIAEQFVDKGNKAQ